MQLFLQAWGGLLFLLNKILFWSSEHAQTEQSWRKRRIWAWSVYLGGITPWLIIFAQNRNWIAISIEASGIPSLVLGLYLAVRGRDTKVPKWLDWFALVGIMIGMVVSVKDFGGFTTLNQYLELALALGFLYGVYRLAKDQVDGYFGFMIMNGANAVLMGVQDQWLLMGQQMLSLLFVMAAYRTKVRKQQRRQALIVQLESHGIDPTTWGEGPTKTLDELLEEIEAGETVLDVVAGVLTRTVQIACVHIYFSHPTRGRLKLREDRQVFRNGTDRKRNFAHSVSEKCLGGEDSDQAGFRGCQEELGIPQEAFWPPMKRWVDTEALDSPSYPGLASKYVHHHVELSLRDGGHFNSNGYMENDGKKLTYFNWVSAD